MNGTDVAIGWGLIAVAALACYYGIPYLLVNLADGIAASAEQGRLQREVAREESDEALRQEMLAWLEEDEQRDTNADLHPLAG